MANRISQVHPLSKSTVMGIGDI